MASATQRVLYPRRCHLSRRASSRAAGPLTTITEDSEWYNGLIREHSGVARRLRDAVAAYLREYVTYGDDVAGFHIFEGPGIATRDQPQAHFDRRFRRLHWPGRPSKVLSVTLPLRLPEAGAALDTWNVSEEGRLRLARHDRGRSIEAWMRIKPVTRTEYSIGSAFVHPWMMLHRISAIPYVNPDDQRVTLQAHGVRIDREYGLSTGSERSG